MGCDFISVGKSDLEAGYKASGRIRRLMPGKYGKVMDNEENKTLFETIQGFDLAVF